MADQPPPNALAAAYPSPPPFYENFTPENIQRIATLRAAQEAESSSSSSDSKAPKPEDVAKPSLRLLDLPPELRFLQPPEPPINGIYRSFGDLFNLNESLPSLTEQGIEQLYTPPSTPSSSPTFSPHSDRALILKRIAKSLLLNFLELMGIMSVNPAQYEQKVQDLRTLFINFHHLLNEYRPHQARESLIMMMEDQLERSKKETEGIEEMKGKVEGILKGLGQAKLISGEVAGAEKAEGVGKGESIAELSAWDELQKEFG